MWAWLVIPAFPLWWLFVVWMIGIRWRSVASEYPARDEPTGERFRWQSARIGGIRYNNAIVIHRAENGLYLRPWGPFKYFHPPIFLPWWSLHRPRKAWRGFVELDVDHAPTVRLPQRVLGDAPIR